MPQLINVEPGSLEWLAARRAGVTATDIVTILGLSTHDSVYSLYWRKLGQVPDEQDRDRWALGRHMEPYIVQRWVAVADMHPSEGALYRNARRVWQMATPDRVIWPWQAANGQEFPINAVLECKSWADADKRSWEAGPPAAIRAQLLWQMDTLGVSTGYWAVVFLPSGRFEHGTIEHSPTHRPREVYQFDDACDICKDIVFMEIEGLEFYRRITLELPPPDLDSSAATLAAVRARFTPGLAKTAEVDTSVYAAWSDAKDCEKSFADLARGYEIELRAQAGEATELTVDGRLAARRLVFDAPVKAHTRHMDYYKRVKQTGDDE